MEGGSEHPWPEVLEKKLSWLLLDMFLDTEFMRQLHNFMKVTLKVKSIHFTLGHENLDFVNNCNLISLFIPMQINKRNFSLKCQKVKKSISNPSL